MTATAPAPLPVETLDAQSVLGPPRRSFLSKQTRRTTALVTVALIAISFVWFTPLLWTLMAATKPTRDAFASPPHFLYHPTSQAFVNLWQGTDFARYLENTVIVGLMAVVMTLLLAAPAAYALARYGGKISAVILGGAMLLRSIPYFSIALPFYQFSLSLHVHDTKLALAVALVAVDQPFSIWLLRNFFTAISPDLDEAAMIDGCTRWGAFRRVVLPIAAPGIATAAMLTFLLAFQSFLLPVVLTDTNSETVPVFLSTQIGQTLPLLQQASAGVTLLSLPVIALAFVAQRFLIAGLTAGSVKG